MSTMHCPYCHVKTSITPTTRVAKVATYETIVDVSWNLNNGNRWWIGQCNNCHKPVLVFNKAELVFPNPMPSETSDLIPEHIRSNLVEAKKCHSVSAWRSTVVMCRRAIQIACLDKGANPNNNLVAQINELKSNGVITQDLHDWATVVRWVGNDGAHPGGSEPDQEDALSMIDLTEQFLHVLYVAPAKAAQHRAKLGK